MGGCELEWRWGGVFSESPEKRNGEELCGRNQEEAGEREEQYEDENGRNDW